MDFFLNFQTKLTVHLENNGFPSINIFFAPYFADGTLDLSVVEPRKPIAVVVYPRRVQITMPESWSAGYTPVNFELWVGYPYSEEVSDKITTPRDIILNATWEIYRQLLANTAIQPTTTPEVEFFDFDDGAGITRYSWGKTLLSVILC